MINKIAATLAGACSARRHQSQWRNLIEADEQRVRTRQAAVKVAYDGKGLSILGSFRHPVAQGMELLEQSRAGMVGFR